MSTASGRRIPAAVLDVDLARGKVSLTLIRAKGLMVYITVPIEKIPPEERVVGAVVHLVTGGGQPFHFERLPEHMLEPDPEWEALLRELERE